jgi:hypothetical protein
MQCSVPNVTDYFRLFHHCLVSRLYNKLYVSRLLLVLAAICCIKRGNKMVRSARRNTIATALNVSLLSLIIVAHPLGARAQEATFNGFGASVQFPPPDQGLNPSVAAYEGTVVEVSNSTQGAGPLLYRVGKVNGSTITWGERGGYDNSGSNPSVAVTGNTVVEVHNGGAGPGVLSYHTGTLNGTTINWNSSSPYDNGFNPSVAVTGNTVVEVHNGGAGVGPLWYRMGTLNGTKLTWHDSHKFDNYSTNPSVAVYPCPNSSTFSPPCAALVVEVHNDNAAPGPLWYRYGQSNDGSQIPSWNNQGGAVIYDSAGGWNPKIAWGPLGLLEVHNRQAGAVGPLLYHTGQFVFQNNNPAISFDQPAVGYDDGNNPSVAVTSGPGCWTAIEVHNGGTGLGPEWYHVGTYTCPTIINVKPGTK